MFKELVRVSRSCRTFDKNRAVTPGELTELIEIVAMTPSGVNAQSLKYKLVWEQSICDELTQAAAWAAALRELKLPPTGSEPTAYVVGCLDESLNHIPAHIIDLGISAQTIMLAATEKGLGGCMIRSFKADKVKNILKLPENITPLMLIALGKPAEQVQLVELPESGATTYYRDEMGVHCVPKRSAEELIIE